MELKFTATGSGAARERLRRSRQPPTRVFSLVLGLIAAALVLRRTGTTSEPGRIRWDREAVTFDAGNVGTRASQTLSGTNVGGTGMVVGRLRLEGTDARDFRLEKDGCSGRKLAPKETCRTLVVWQSKTPGRKTAQVLLDGEVLAEPASVRVEGEAMAPAAPPIAEPTRTPTPEEPTPSPTQAEPTASPTQAEPTASPTPAAPLVAHVRFEPPSLSLPDTNPHSVRLVNDGPGWLVIRDVTDRAPSGVTLQVDSRPCKGRKIPPGDSCPVAIAWREPAGLDVSGVDILVTDNAPDSPQSLAVHLSSWIRADLARIDFGAARLVQSHAKPVGRRIVLTNVSGSVVEMRPGIDSGVFRTLQSDCGRPISSGQSCTVLLIFAPREETAYTDFLRIRAPGFPLVSIPVAGTGTR
jgi:hypothetical protein